MHLVAITRAAESPFQFTCLRCGVKRFTDNDPGARADLEGKSFHAYYCGTCAVELANAGEAKGDVPQ